MYSWCVFLSSFFVDLCLNLMLGCFVNGYVKVGVCFWFAVFVDD